MTVTDRPSKFYPHFVNGGCGLTIELTHCPESHRGSGAEGVCIQTFLPMRLNSVKSQREPVHHFKQADGGGGKVVLSSRVMNMSSPGLLWVLLFHRCNERYTVFP